MTSESAQPNFLFITTDQQHWHTLSCLGAAVATPNLDRLASKGTLFTRAYCPNPTCTPSRASMITGQYPSQHGAYSLGTKLAEDTACIGDYLRSAGYFSALVGKAHLQQLHANGYPSVEAYPVLQDLEFWRTFNAKHTPWYGFDHVELARNHVAEPHVGQHYALWMEEKGYSNWRDYFHPPTGTDNSVEGEQFGQWLIPQDIHYNEWICERTNALMSARTNDQQPFFLWASFFDPHPAYLVPEPWASMYDPHHIEVPQGMKGEHVKNPAHFAYTQDPHATWDEFRNDPEGNHIHGSNYHRDLESRQAPNGEASQAQKNLAIYYGMIAYLDHSIGKILDHLEQLGIEQNTLIVFTTDHGHFVGQHGLHYKGPFHYEDMIKIPFIASYPGHIPAGERSNSLQTLVDLAPTWLDFCNAPIPRTMNGVSQKAVWCGDEQQAHHEVFCENRHQPHTLYAKTCIWQRYKLTLYNNGEDGELWDLENDPNEFNNLWHEPEHLTLKSQLLLKFQQAQMKLEPIPMPRVAPA